MTNPESPKSDTPETDAAIRDMSYRDECGQLIGLHMVDPEFARSLERRLNQALAERDEYKWQAEKLTDTLQSVLRAYEGSLPDPERFEVSTDTKNRLAFIQDLWNKFIAKRK